MNATQFYLAIAVAPGTTIVIVLIGVLNNQNMNHRLNDFKDLLKSEIGRVETRLDTIETKLEGRVDRMESALLSQIAGLDARVRRIEEKLNIR